MNEHFCVTAVLTILIFFYLKNVIVADLQQSLFYINSVLVLIFFCCGYKIGLNLIYKSDCFTITDCALIFCCTSSKENIELRQIYDQLYFRVASIIVFYSSLVRVLNCLSFSNLAIKELFLKLYLLLTEGVLNI